MLQDFVERDDVIVDLAKTISCALAFVEATDPLAKIKLEEDAVRELLVNITTCVLFIKEYSIQGQTGISSDL